MTYKIIRSKRKTLGIEVNSDGVTVRAPMKISDREIEKFVSEHILWIEKNLKKIKARQTALADIKPLSDEELDDLVSSAKKLIPERVEIYAQKIGVRYGRITIRKQRSKWGSCSSKGNLNFNCLLMLAPLSVIDSVVVHELCHLKEMNHSERFYAEVLKAYPDYYQQNKWLKENGPKLMARLKKG